MTSAVTFLSYFSIIAGVSTLSVSPVRYRLCRHEGGQVVECWTDQRCQDVLYHNPSYKTDFYEFGDSCSGSRSCFISSSSRVKCEVTLRSLPVSSSAGGNIVLGFDLGNHKIVKPAASPYSRDQQTSLNIVNPGNDLLKPKIILGLRRSPIRVQGTTLQPNTRTPDFASSGLIYSDYDDTDVNPNIIVNYLNRKNQRNRAPPLKSDPSKSFKKVENSPSHKMKLSDYNEAKYEETLEHEYIVDINNIDHDPTDKVPLDYDVTIPDTTPILTANVQTNTKKAPQMLLSSSPSLKPSIESTTTFKTTNSATSFNSLPTTSSMTSSKEDETTETLNVRSTSPPDDFNKSQAKTDTNILPTPSSNADINYILNILDLTNVSKEYKSRKYIQSSLQSS